MHTKKVSLTVDVTAASLEDAVKKAEPVADGFFKNIRWEVESVTACEEYEGELLNPDRETQFSVRFEIRQASS